MDILRTAGELSDWRLDLRSEPIVLVPTMGALHEGHLSLVRRAEKRGRIVVSIFVNPTQFGAGEDFDAYPRDLESDLALLEPLGVDAVFAPTTNQMYGRPDGVSICPGRRARGLCADQRPGHFTGVLTIVAKLLNLVRPDLAIFGRKDAQQCLVIDEMVADLKMPVALLDAATVREPDGLAMSSRNRYLSAGDRERALCLHRALEYGRDRLTTGERDPQTIMRAMLEELSAADAVDYAEIRQVPDLEAPRVAEGRLLLAVAARVGPARLIDNLVLEVAGETVSASHLLDSGRNR